jgi:hypothetical protein
LQLVTITLDNLNLIKKKEEEDIIGLENSLMFMKENLKQVKETVEEHFGGLMVAGMKVNSKMVYKVVMGCFIDMEDKFSMKVSGIMECLMEKELNSLKMEKDMKDNLRKINSMEMVFSIKMIQLFMVFGRTTSSQLSIWSNLF